MQGRKQLAQHSLSTTITQQNTINNIVMILKSIQFLNNKSQSKQVKIKIK